MKITSLILFSILCFACNSKTTGKPKEESINNRILKPHFQSIIDSSKVIGSILIHDSREDIYYSNDFEWSNKGSLPASTFKIANSIIGLETRVIESDNTIFKWDGNERELKVWEQDLVLKDAFQFSCVPCYQEVAKKIGTKRMNDYVQKLNYGNLKIDSTNIDDFWLLGQSRISQMQQIDFLKRFYNRQLDISERTEKIVKNIMLIEETDHYRLCGKSGLSNENGVYNGWFVGYIEMKDNTYFFATNLEPKEGFDFDSFIQKRIDVTLSAFKTMRVLK